MTFSTPHAVLALFVRHPVPGQVKTRLARDIGEEGACDLYQAMVADIIDQAGATGLPLCLFHDGQESGVLPLEWQAAADRVFPQSGLKLGERMVAAFEQLFSSGAEQVVLIGSDIPALDATLMMAAVAALGSHDAVFAPAPDGGYCLVAFRRDGFCRQIFVDIPWSTERVLELSLAGCRANGVSSALLEARQDIDTLDDLKRYCARPSSTARRTNAWLNENGITPAGSL